MYIAVGPGLIVLVEVSEEPSSGAEIKMGDDRLRKRGLYRLTREGEYPREGKNRVPYFQATRVGDLDSNEAVLPIASLLTC